MSNPSNIVSIHPYFKVRPGQMDDFRTLLAAFLEKTSAEKGVWYYEFTVNGDEVFCREAYRGAEAALEHLTNVGPLVDAALKISDLLRLEIHGPAAELEKLKVPLAALNPAWFTLECGLTR